MEQDERAIADGVRLWWTKRVALNGLLAALLFGSAGTLEWEAGWRVVSLAFAGLIAEGAFLPRALKADRSRVQEGSKRWDVLWTRFAGIGLYFAIFVSAGLDARFGWTAPLPGALVLGAFALWLLAYAIGLAAMTRNPYFSRTVRIQTAHRVIDRGPYALVRHPGYVASALFLVTTPLLMESWWSAVPSLIALVLLVARTAAEDGTLRRELDGYREYAARVRFRLVPGLW